MYWDTDEWDTDIICESWYSNGEPLWGGVGGEGLSLLWTEEVSPGLWNVFPLFKIRRLKAGLAI